MWAYSTNWASLSHPTKQWWLCLKLLFPFFRESEYFYTQSASSRPISRNSSAKAIRSRGNDSVPEDQQSLLPSTNNHTTVSLLLSQNRFSKFVAIGLQNVIFAYGKNPVSLNILFIPAKLRIYGNVTKDVINLHIFSRC